MKRTAATLAIVALLAAGCGSSESSDTTNSDTDNTEVAPESTPEAEEATASLVITGEIAYAGDADRTTPGILTITLADTSLQDVSYVVIAEMTIELLDDGPLPIPFELGADTAGLDERGMFSLLAAVTGPDGSLLWTTDTDNPIDITQTDVDFGTLTLISATG